jgi:hypothetical protein
MRTSSIPGLLVICHALTGCADGAAPDEAAVADSVQGVSDDATDDVIDDAIDVRAKPATIHITSEFPPAVVVFREGLRGRWRPARQITATTFEAKVRGPYVVTVVCAEHPIFFENNETLTWQVARTPDDPRDLSFCDPLPPQHEVTGHMVQPGFVQIADSGERSSVPDWDFDILVPSGSFDLIATSADAINVRRGISVDGDLAVTPPVDLAQEGTALVDVAFSAPNATPDEITLVSVGLFTQTTALPARVFLGPLDAAKAAPDAALIPSDTQSASVRASSGNALRALRRPFRVGGDTVHTLPPPLAPVQWKVIDGEISVHWTALPPFTTFSEFIGGSALFPLTPPSYLVDLSPRFIAATRIRHFQIDTDIPGFQPQWLVDFTDFYSRNLTVQKVPAPGVVITNNISEIIEPAQPQLALQARATAAPSIAPTRRARGAAQP